MDMPRTLGQAVTMHLRSSDTLREVMAHRSLSQAQLAQAVGRSPVTVNHLLRGRMTTCSLDLAAGIAEALDVPLDDLFAPTVASRTGRFRARSEGAA